RNTDGFETPAGNCVRRFLRPMLYYVPSKLAECWPPYGECDRAKSKSRWRQRCNQHPKTGQSIEIGSRLRSRMARAEISDHVGTASLAGKSRAKMIRLGLRRPCMRGQPPEEGEGATGVHPHSSVLWDVCAIERAIATP